jgi:cytosol alanyl aminopeptidase
VLDRPALRRLLLGKSLLALLCGCAGAAQTPAQARTSLPPTAAADAIPSRLPLSVRPLSYVLELKVMPKTDHFSGRTQITVVLENPSDRIWLHGKGLHVTAVKAHVQEDVISGSYQQLNDDGVAALSFERPVPSGQSVLDIEYDAPFDTQLKGLYRVESGGDSYAFTQFEAISARNAFPSFDEPGFKTPFELWVTVPADDVAASNTKVIAYEVTGDEKRVHFAQTKPLPTYLVALAVGPLDVVDAPPAAANAVRTTPLALRALCVKGKGKLLAHALAEVAPTLSALEAYFGIAYPYDKLDIVAVPDFAAGAMENAGLVTFRDWLLLIDPLQSSEGQRRASAFVLAHELAHQWVGDLVTMRYWDDIWLNEAFATFMEYRVMASLHPDYKPELDLAADMQEAMESDSRVSARMIRQPITSVHDIQNAFDSITYSKGGGVIAMFERYLGAAAFQKGVHEYLSAHAFGNASTEDLLKALRSSSGKDVTAPFMSFLTQVGVPLVEAKLTCTDGKLGELQLKQSRYLPLGSSGSAEQHWQIPVCARYQNAAGMRESCTLLSEPTGSLALTGGCANWLMPNADGAGYYRFTLPSADLEKLRTQGLRKLSARERLTLAKALRAGFEAGSVSADDWLGTMPLLAADPERSVAMEPLDFLADVRDHWLSDKTRPALEAFVRKLYLPVADRLGLRERKGEAGELKLWRANVLHAVAALGNDPATRKRLAGLGAQYLGIGGDGELHPEVLPSELADSAVEFLVVDGDDAVFDEVYQRLLKAEDATQRTRYLRALGLVKDTRASKALALALDPALRVNEVLLPLRMQLSDWRTRDAAYTWFERNFDKLAKRVPEASMGSTPWLATTFCDATVIRRLQSFFAPRIEKLQGGPRSLEGAIETLRLCDALVSAQRASVVAFFEKL